MLGKINKLLSINTIALPTLLELLTFFMSENSKYATAIAVSGRAFWASR